MVYSTKSRLHLQSELAEQHTRAGTSVMVLAKIELIYGKCPCVHYIFARFFFRSKREQIFFCSQENQVLEIYIFRFHDVIKCLGIKQEIHFTE